MSAPSVHIEKHPPERRHPTVTTLHCGCTCCCCCCLHTLGSLVGAAVAPAIGRGRPMAITYYYDDETGEAIPDVRKAGLSSVTVFWWILSLQIFLGFLYAILTNPSRGESLLIAGVIILLIFPALQLASAFMTLIIFAVWRRGDRFYQLKQLGKITAGTVIGSILGITLMTVIAAMFGAFR